MTGGHIYVIRFKNDDLKIGRTQRIRTRIKQLGWDRQNDYLPIADGWYSEEHDEWIVNELRLLVFCHEQYGDPIKGRETFRGDFAKTAAYAESLPGLPTSAATS